MTAKSLFLPLLTIICIFSCQQTQTHSDSLEECTVKIKKIMQNQVDSWNSGSIDGFMQGYWRSDELRFVTKNGVRLGYDSVANNYKRHYHNQEKMGKLSFKNMAFFSLPPDKKNEVINVTGQWFVAQTEKTDSGFFTIFFTKIDSEWKIVIDNTW